MDSLLKFKVVGFIPSPEFQKVRFYLENLHRLFPDKIDTPEIRPMLNVAWNEYLMKLHRTEGEQSWEITTVVVFFNDKFLGNDKDFLKYLSRCVRIKFKGIDFEQLGCEQLVQHLNDLVYKYNRSLAYLTISVNFKYLGSLLFMLYSDLVPYTCAAFLNTKSSCCTVHRIVKNGWMEFNCPQFKIPHTAAENYIVPHDRRGILSMCLSKNRKMANFFITFQPSSWMDLKFVAFGQLIQGEEILAKLEAMANRSQAPMNTIRVEEIGEYFLEYRKKGEVEVEVSYTDFGDERISDDQSLMSDKYRKGLYCLSTDVLGVLRGLTHSYEIHGE